MDGPISLEISLIIVCGRGLPKQTVYAFKDASFVAIWAFVRLALFL